MLQTLHLGPTRIGRKSAIPPFLSPLVLAAECGADLIPQIESVTHRFGFDSFAYRASTKLHPDEEKRIFEFSTLPALWAIRYDQRAYVEVDPRVTEMWDCGVPLIWDQPSARTRNSIVNSFLDDALEHGIASGVSIPLFDEVATKITVDLVSRSPNLSSDRMNRIHRELGDMFLFAKCFHELFRRAALERRISARSVGMPISPRERECLELVANGEAIDAISKRLQIDVRSVETHFDSIRSKLEITRLRDAIALLTDHGL